MADSVRARPSFGREETTDRPADRLVAFAHYVFEPSSIQYTDVTAHIVNQPSPLKRASGQADTTAGNSEQLSYIVMSEDHRIGTDAVLRHQQPARQALLCCMKPITDNSPPDGSIGAESASLQVIAPIDATERSISPAKQSRRDEEREDGRRSRVEDCLTRNGAIFDPRPSCFNLQASSRSSWSSFHRSRESIRNVCDAGYCADANRRRAICQAIRCGPACF